MKEGSRKVRKEDVTTEAEIRHVTASFEDDMRSPESRRTGNFSKLGNGQESGFSPRASRKECSLGFSPTLILIVDETLIKVQNKDGNRAHLFLTSRTVR